jgi:hypothetical protein
MLSRQARCQHDQGSQGAGQAALEERTSCVNELGAKICSCLVDTLVSTHFVAKLLLLASGCAPVTLLAALNQLLLASRRVVNSRSDMLHLAAAIQSSLPLSSLHSTTPWSQSHTRPFNCAAGLVRMAANWCALGPAAPSVIEYDMHSMYQPMLSSSLRCYSGSKGGAISKTASSWLISSRLLACSAQHTRIASHIWSAS